MRIPYLTLFLSAITLAIAAVPGAADTLTLSREGLSEGSIWQLFTSHFCHWSGGHLFWDLLVFAVLGAWMEFRGRKSYGIFLFTTLPILAWSALALTPAIDEYRGLSGIDSALFGWAAIGIWTDTKSAKQRIATVLALFAFAAKSAVELLISAPLFVQDLGENVIAVPAIHLTGLAAGVLMGNFFTGAIAGQKIFVIIREIRGSEIQHLDQRPHNRVGQFRIKHLALRSSRERDRW